MEWFEIIKCPKNRGSRKDGRRRHEWPSPERRKRRSQKRRRIKERVPGPLRFSSLPWLGKTFLHCRNVPVPSQGQRVKDELGMRQGGEGGPSRVGLCHDLHARFGKGARGEGAGGSFVQSLRGPARGPDVEWSRRSEIRRPAGEIRRLVVWSLVDPPRPLSASSRLAASRVLASPQVLSESLAGVSAHHPQTRGRL